MSEHHRVAGGWATASPGGREDGSAGAAAANPWWPNLSDQQQQQQQQQQQVAAQQQAAAVAAAQQQQAQQQQSLHQHLLNQQAAAQQQLSQHQQDIVRSTAAATQQLFSYKMASSFQNPATTGTQSSPVSSSSPVAMKGYDYRTGVPVSASSGPAGVQWWYPSQMMDQQNNLHQQQLQQGQHLSSITTQTSTPQILSPHQLQQLQHHQNNLQQNNAILHQNKALKSTKPRGRMTAYAFFVQICRQEHKKKHPDENIVFQEFSKKCAARWKTMNDKEKKRFHEMAEKDKKRYDTEMQSYIPPKGEKVTGRGKKRRQMKDPNAPKRSLSAFFWFCNDERGKVKMLNPEYGVGEIAKELGKRWSDTAPEVKSKYEAMAEKDKARYERDMTAYKKKLKDGTGVGVPVVAKKEASEEEWEEEDE
ncbi:high mobility group protein DSP1 [Copidosoma floridanum]|uniref:high mobility group protein DSP1 n=1 Tax=Copidosoma floridanum TaxID=29053 RepID=UPI0006C995BE|nr:high mobility group protein DSP1 [Copidosoma floridanum]